MTREEMDEHDPSLREQDALERRRRARQMRRLNPQDYDDAYGPDETDDEP